MRLFNTMSQQIAPFTPIREGHASMYVCGVTPYDTAHMGHAFVFSTFDVLRRWLTYQGIDVTYVQNVTDIDDPLFAKAKQLGNISWEDLARQETDRFIREMTAINIEMPTHFVRASDELPAMFEIIEQLLQNGNAYINDGWIYFAVKTDATYATLAKSAGLSGYDNLLNTANENGNDGHDPRKRDPLDFLLWRGETPGEPSWQSPWGLGRPGWHIECSAMSTRYLGPQIDIHGGGSDLIFPHHSSEIAQTENASGEKPFVRHWMHVGLVSLDGTKMSKSLGNLIIIGNLLKVYSPNAIRLMLAEHHYRAPWEFFNDDMHRAQRLADDIAAALQGPVSAEHPIPGSEADRMLHAYTDAMDHDLDTPAALSAVRVLAESLLHSILPTEEQPAGRHVLRHMVQILGWN